MSTQISSTYLANAFSSNALQNSFGVFDRAKRSFPSRVGKRSSITTSIHSSKRQKQKRKIPQYALLFDHSCSLASGITLKKSEFYRVNPIILYRIRECSAAKYIPYCFCPLNYPLRVYRNC